MSGTEQPPRARRVLVVTDSRGGPTATQKISFAQPFDTAFPGAAFEIKFEKDHRDSASIAKAIASHRPELLVLSRFTSATGVEWIGRARDAAIPVVFHIDDDLLEVPASLGEAKYNAYNRPERLKALRDNIESSDLCYVSTAELGNRLKHHGIQTKIVAGELYCSVSPDEIGPLVPPATGPVIGYMGSSGHSADLDLVLPAICEIMDLVPAVRFELFGTIRMPAELGRFGPRVRRLPPVADYRQFIPHMRLLGWWVGLAPLEDNGFNRCKADTKWVEYSLAGMAVVASDIAVYRRACADGGGVMAATTRQWVEAVLRLIYRPRERAAIVDAAQRKLRDSYSHQRLREQVSRMFDEALANGPKIAPRAAL